MAPFGSDQHSRGCHLHTSQISESTRLSRVLMAVCVADIGRVSRGARGAQDGGVGMLHRGDRGDLRLCQRGRRRLEYVLNAGGTIPGAFYISI
jgi:hypothetical protein